MNWSKDNQLKSNIAYILHQADLMATKIEYDEWQRGYDEVKVEKKENVKENTEKSKRAHDLFKELFDE